LLANMRTAGPPAGKRVNKVLPKIIRTLVVAASLLAGHGDAFAMMPLAQPEPFTEVDPGRSEPFVGSWAISIPTMDVAVPDSVLASCDLPVRIQAADDTHIFSLGPHETEADAAIELQRLDGGAMWEPIAGGPNFFAFWVSADVFYLYDEVPQVEADWGLPYVYRRC
jgi:hypothetical protein